MRVTEKELMVLRALDQWRRDFPGASPDHHQIAISCGKEYSSGDWAHAPLRALRTRELVEVVGKQTYGGRLWRITEAGREALAAMCR